MFTWSLIDLFAILFFFFSYYFLHVFITNTDLPSWGKIVGVVSIIPAAIWTFLGYNLINFDANFCEATENSWVTSYPYYVEAIFLMMVFVLITYYYRKAKQQALKTKILLAGLGISLFLFFFLSATWLARILVNYPSTAEYAYNYEIYGLFGMPLLLGFLAYLVVRYHAFNIKLFGAQVLIVSLIILLGSEFLFIEALATKILAAITLVITGAIGISLIRSVKKEIEQREQIERLAGQLEKANTQLKQANLKLTDANSKLKDLDRQKTEFLSIASHQLRSPITAIKGYASMLLEGSFGEVTEKAKGAVDVIYQSCQKLAIVIEDFLDITRIELGRMKYAFAPANLREVVESVVKQMMPIALARHLTLSFAATEGDYALTADVGKLTQVATNLIDNAIKYTKEGKVEVRLTKLKNKYRVTITDTGVGMDEVTIKRLFQKFSRADDASKTNVNGTGLGLYVAKQLAEAHGGKLWAESAGVGKGSTFNVELPTNFKLAL